jgi:hypothetical protein
MRLIKVSAPEGKGEQVAQTAFAVGIEKVSIQQVENHKADGKIEMKDAVDMETSTPKAKHFVDALLTADFYNQDDFSLSIRTPLSIVSGESMRELTKPLTDAVTDILQELWQFSHITYDFVGRVFIGACLLAYGLIQQQILLIIAGLLFLPLLPLLLAIGFGAWTSKWKLVGQSSLALLTAIVLLVLGGVFVALLAKPPVKYDEFNSLLVSFLISFAVGVAAGLAHIDDAGKREMIGLAATAQTAIVPVWFGICLVFGFPPTASESDITNRALSFFVNIATIIVTAMAVYALTRAATRSIARVRE